MKSIIAIALTCVSVTSALAQTKDAAGRDLVSVTFGNLGAPNNGRILYCSDCTQENPTASGGSGAVVRRENGAWNGGGGALPIGNDGDNQIKNGSAFAAGGINDSGSLLNIPARQITAARTVTGTGGGIINAGITSSITGSATGANMDVAAFSAIVNNASTKVLLDGIGYYVAPSTGTGSTNFFGVFLSNQTGYSNAFAFYSAAGAGPSYLLGGLNTSTITATGNITAPNILVSGLTTTGAAGSKKVVCVDTATGQLYASSTGTDCSN